MRRREFIVLLGAAAWPLSARAQQIGRLPTIGFLGAATPAVWAPWTVAFENWLDELGWMKGRTVAIEYRWAEGRSERFTEIVTEFVRFNVDAIVTAGTESTIAVKQATSEVPIVFALATDAVAAGLVASLARPGGNVTGFSHQGTDIAAKGLELLREILPNLRLGQCQQPRQCAGHART
jgi:putative tryptophan/tyrosine transport system substrate-binding protein